MRPKRPQTSTSPLAQWLKIPGKSFGALLDKTFCSSSFYEVKFGSFFFNLLFLVVLEFDVVEKAKNSGVPIILSTIALKI